MKNARLRGRTGGIGETPEGGEELKVFPKSFLREFGYGKSLPLPTCTKATAYIVQEAVRTDFFVFENIVSHSLGDLKC